MEEHTLSPSRTADNHSHTSAVVVDPDDLSSPSPVLQDALGVTRQGTCLRHPNCPVLFEDRVMSCRVCFSEEKSVGIRQRKSFAAVVQQLQRMANTSNRNLSFSDIATDNMSSQDTLPESSSSTTVPTITTTTTTTGSSSMLPPTASMDQTLESIMKRLAQVQNWMLRQKEKEVLSLQLTIHRLEQRLKDQDAQVLEQRETIRALRKTIQQDLKIIKTMATQKEREMGAASTTTHSPPLRRKASQKQSLLQTEDEEADEEHDDENMLYESPSKAKATVPPAVVVPLDVPAMILGDDDRSPSKHATAGSKSSPPSKSPPTQRTLQRYKTPPAIGRPLSQLEQFKRAGRKNLLEPERHIKRGSSSRSLDAGSVASMPIAEEIDEDDSDDDDDNENAIFIPHSNRASEYWNDDDMAFATDPSRIFASFRGGLLDIPKSPPPACHNNKRKLKLKLQLDQQDRNVLKVPSMRSIQRTHSGMSDAGDSVVDGPAGATTTSGGGNIPLHLLAAQLNTMPSLDHSTHTHSLSVPGTPVSMIETTTPSSSASPPSNDLKPKQRTVLLPPVAPPPMLNNSTDDEKSPVVKTSRIPLSAAFMPNEVEIRLNTHMNDSSTVMSATYSVETLETSSLALQSETSTNKPDALPPLLEQVKEEVVVDDSKSHKFVFSVTRASCQDRYGDPGIYTGTILVTEGLPHGNGIMSYENGRVYEGEWERGHWNGKGSLLNPNGDTYTGGFVFDARHGQGTYKWDNGDVYVGNFSQDKRHGKGKFSFHNGNMYEGEFNDGMFEGYGMYSFDGGYYEGEWKQGRYDGNGELVYVSGGKYTGEFRNSVAHGFGMEVTAEGHKRRGVWENGQPAEYFERH